MNQCKPPPVWLEKEWQDKVATPFLQSNLKMGCFGPFIRERLHLLSPEAFQYLSECDNINKIAQEEILCYLLEQQLIDNE